MRFKSKLFGISLIALMACSKEEEPVIIVDPEFPTVETSQVEDFGEYKLSATLKGKILDEGTCAVLARGFCWDTIPEVDVNSNYSTNGLGNGEFEQEIDNLLPNGVTYYVRAYASNCEGLSYGDIQSFTTDTLPADPIAVGDTTEGGVVFYIFKSGDDDYVQGEIHGLVAAMEDQGEDVKWGCYGVEIDGADEVAVGTGNQNTLDILASCSEVGTGAEICANLELNGYDDWFLPSYNALNWMFKNLADSDGDGVCNGPDDVNNITKFSYGSYLSSSEYSTTEARMQNFVSGARYRNGREYESFYIRAVRKF